MNEASLLIVDHDVPFRNSLARFCTDNGCYIAQFSSIQPVLNRLCSGDFDIAIVDFCDIDKNKPRYSALLNRPSRTELILTSGSHTIETELEARLLSPAYYFVKPAAINDIFAVVVRIIEMNASIILRELQNNHRCKGEHHE